MAGPKNAAIRDGGNADAMVLAGFAVAAGHGLMEMFYGGLLPGKTTQQIVAERRVLRPGGFAEASRWRVLEDGDGHICGGLNAFPYDVFFTSTPDELLTADRLSTVASLSEMEEGAAGSYYINMIAVAPEARGLGFGDQLIREAERLARTGGFSRLALSTFEADAALIRFYRRNGFEITATAPITPHPLLEHKGNWALMGKELDPETPHHRP